MRLLLALLLSLLPLPALADVTATYAVGKQILLVEADEGGNGRIMLEGKFGILRRGGVDYALLALPTGEIRVTELTELLTLMSGMIKGEAPKDSKGEIVDRPFVLLAKGEAMVGDRKGSLWSFGPEKETDGRPGERKEFVMSTDPVLAPIGAIFAHTVDALLPLMAAVIPESTGFASKTRELLAKGTPLRVDTLFALQSVATAEIDPKHFELPSPAVPAIEFLSALGAGGAEFKPLP